jgi:hypothetical protein
LQGGGEVVAFGADLLPFGDEEAAGELRGGEWRDGWGELGFAVEVFLPVGDGTGGGRLAGGTMALA